MSRLRPYASGKSEGEPTESDMSGHSRWRSSAARKAEWHRYRHGHPPGWASGTGGHPRRFRPISGRRGSRHAPWPGAIIAGLCFHLIDNWMFAVHLAHPRDLIGCALLLIGPLALAWRGRAPIAVLAVAGAAAIGFATLATPSWTYAVAPVIALFTAVRNGHRRAAVGTAAAGYLVYLTVTWFCADPLGLPAAARPAPRDAVLTALGLALTVFIGSAAGARAAYLAELSKVNAERARAKAEQERRQAADERLRIARELHDVLGHHLSLINVQAGVGLHLMDNRPEQAREALTAIKTASSEALREVRAVLGVLRPEEEAAPRQPALGLDRLTDLTADAGLPVTTETVGQQRDLPAEVDRAAYRIVQEALTNVRRHAVPGGAAVVSVTYAPDELRLAIRNDGVRPADAAPAGGIVQRAGVAEGGEVAPAAATTRGGGFAQGDNAAETGEGGGVTQAAARPGAPGDDGGSGIAGMRARAASLGGTLQAGPLADGGFLVSAVLPTRTTSTREPA